MVLGLVDKEIIGLLCVLSCRTLLCRVVSLCHVVSRIELYCVASHSIKCMLSYRILLYSTVQSDNV